MLPKINIEFPRLLVAAIYTPNAPANKYLKYISLYNTAESPYATENISNDIVRRKDTITVKDASRLAIR